MKAKLSTIVTELRGRAATVVAKQSSSGQIILMRSVGRDPKTNPQMRARMNLSNLGHRWGVLTQEQRDDWGVKAGANRSGYDLFCEVNTNMRSIGRPFKDTYVESDANVDVKRITVYSKPWLREIVVEVVATGSVENFDMLYKISQPSDNKLSFQTYNMINIGHMEMETEFEDNLYNAVVGEWGREPERTMYYKMEVWVVNNVSGLRRMIEGGVYEWSLSVPEFQPVVTIDYAQTAVNVIENLGLVRGFLSYRWSNYDPIYTVDYYCGIVIQDLSTGEVLRESNEPEEFNTLEESGRVMEEIDDLDSQDWWVNGKALKLSIWIYFRVSGSNNWDKVLGHERVIELEL